MDPLPVTPHPSGGDASGRPPSTVTVRDGKGGLPYSKGLMATSVMAAGLPPLRAYHVAEVIERRLLQSTSLSVSSAELRDMAAEVLEEEVGVRYAENYRSWQRFQDRTVPLIVLLGGATGTGKSTVATRIAARTGIVRIVSTDAIREVMRGIFTKEMMPTLHTSSFDTTTVLREPPDASDPVLAGFRRQVHAVSVGVTQLIRRAVIEGTDLLVEGAHIVPGFLQLPGPDEALVSSMVVTVDDEQLHRSHFAARAQENRGQRNRNYLEHFDAIRKIQDYVRSLAVEHDVPIVGSYGLDATVSRVMELIVSSDPERTRTTGNVRTAPTASAEVPTSSAAARQ